MTTATTLPEYVSATNDFDGIDVGVSTPPPNFTLHQLTEGIIGGKGVFDVMMRVAREHLNIEYEKNRITGKEYATVYAQLYGSTLQAAGQYLIQAREAERVNAQTGLFRQQTNTELAKTSDTVSTTLAFNDSATLGGLTKAQIDNVLEDTAVKTKQTEVQDAQIALYGKQATGFDRDAEQKLAKIYADVYMAYLTADPNAISGGSGLENPDIYQVLDKARTGHGVAATPDP